MNQLTPTSQYLKYKRGDTFLYKDDEGGKDFFILALVAREQMALISLFGGNRYVDPVQTETSFRVSQSEWEAITGGDSHCFSKTIHHINL